MNIIFIGFKETENGYYKSVLKSISSENELSFYYKAEDAFNAFRNVIIPFQTHVYLIIAKFNLEGYEFAEFVGFFRSSLEKYSYHNFKLSAIPIVIFQDKVSNDLNSYDVSDVILQSDAENSIKFLQMVKDTVKNWRREIYNDLEVLGVGLDYSFNKIDLVYTVQVKSHQTQILSASFIFKQANLPYIWLDKDFFEIEKSIDELQSLVNNYLDMPRELLERNQWEEKLQDFFNRNPKFLFQQNFSDYWSQPKIKIPNSNQSFKPDFIMKPELNPELSKNWEIIDLKLPVQEFV
ncbi:MAG: hypothetical protein EOO43_04080 [Flavobacterium sp.]|nr:MAG: hypothetical protein EOO43_04080 [Flavobacterium sp.]